MGVLILLVNVALVVVYIGTLAYVVLKPSLQRPRDGPSPAASMLRRAAAKLRSASDAAQGAVARALSGLRSGVHQGSGADSQAKLCNRKRARRQEHAA